MWSECIPYAFKIKSNVAGCNYNIIPNTHRNRYDLDVIEMWSKCIPNKVTKESK